MPPENRIVDMPNTGSLLFFVIVADTFVSQYSEHI